MSRSLGNVLPDSVTTRLSGRDLQSVADQVVIVCTVDDDGFPHVALLSYFEVLATDRRTVRIATYRDSRTTRHARKTGKATLVLVDARVAYYVKAAVEELSPSMRATPYNAKLQLRIVDVLADEANPELEPGAYIASGLTYVNPQRAQEFDRARLVLAELQE
jgi:hypothetical protein